MFGDADALHLDRGYGGGSVRTAPEDDLTRVSTLKDSLGDSVKDVIIMNLDTQIGINHCGEQNGGCEELCLYNGTHANCRCYHAQIDTDGKSCKGKHQETLNNMSIRKHLYVPFNYDD